MAITNYQVKFKTKALGSSTTAPANPTSASSGDIVFAYNNVAIGDAGAVRKIYARGQEWDGTNTHLVNTLTFKGGTTNALVWNQASNATINIAAGAGIAVSGSAGKITIAHSDAAGYKHIPTNGSAGQILANSAAGTAAWSASTVGSASRPVFVSKGVVTQCSYTIATSVPSGAVFTDTTYALYVGAQNATANATTATSNPYINLRGTKAGSETGNSDSNIQIVGTSPITVSGKSGVITIGVASGRTIPTTTNVNDWQRAYNWYKATVVDDDAAADTTINKWNEVVNFLNGFADDTNLTTVLAGYADKGHVHDVVSTSKNGFAPKIVNAGTMGTTDADKATMVFTDGGWKVLPSTAFANSTYSAAYTRKVNGTAVGTAYTPSKAASIDYTVGAAAASFGVSGTAGGTNNVDVTVTISGPSLTDTVASSASTTSAFSAKVQSNTLFWWDE